MVSDESGWIQASGDSPVRGVGKGMVIQRMLQSITNKRRGEKQPSLLQVRSASLAYIPCCMDHSSVKDD